MPVVCSANSLPLLPSQIDRSAHKFFISSQNASNEKVSILESRQRLRVVQLYSMTWMFTSVHESTMRHWNMKVDSWAVSVTSFQKGYRSTAFCTPIKMKQKTVTNLLHEVSSRVQLTDNFLICMPPWLRRVAARCRSRTRVSLLIHKFNIDGQSYDPNLIWRFTHHLWFKQQLRDEISTPFQSA